MDLETTQNNVVAKLPLLKQGDYEMWKLRIEQYFQVQDYALWEVIKYGNSFKTVARTTTNADGTSTSTIPGPVTTEEKAHKKNDVKTRSMLQMALPNEHQLTFNQYKDTKTLFEAIQARFGGNEATKKTQKSLLKQILALMFSTASTNDSIATSVDAQTMLFLAKINQIGLKRTGKKIIINGSDNAGYDKSKVECFNYHKMRHFSRECRGPRNQESSKRTVNVEDTSSKAMVAFDGAVEFNKSEFDLATYKRGLASVEEQLVFYKKNEVVFCDQIVVLKRDASFRDLEINALNIQIEKLKKDKESNKIKIDNFKNSSESLDKLIGSQIVDKNRKALVLRSFNSLNLKAMELISIKVLVKIPQMRLRKPLVPPIIEDWVSDYDEDKSEVMVSDNVQHKFELKPEQAKQPRKISENPRNNRTNWNEKKILKLRVGIVPISTSYAKRLSRAATPLSAARHINTAAPKLFVNVAKTKSNVFQKAHSLSRRPFNQQIALNNKSLNNKVNIAKVNFVNTVKGKRMTSAVAEQGINAVKEAHDVYYALKYDWKCLLHQTKSVKYIGKSKEVGTLRYLSLVVPLTTVSDEAVHKELGDRMERAATTASSLEAEQDSDAQTRFEAASKSLMIHLSQELTHLDVGRTKFNLSLSNHMANLEFCDKHNMIAYLQKFEGSEGFHQIIDFLNASHIQYALIENPTIYVSFLKQFWITTTARTSATREIELTATINGQEKTITEASLRRHQKLEDNGGVTTLSNSEIF
ncbi:hypothetical protein Tco_1264931 [Tanacetum coccineum]